MFRVQKALRWRIVLGLLLLAVLPVPALDFFPGRKDQAAGMLRRADALLARADAAYEQGETTQARELYRLALERYEQLHQRDPRFHDGLPRFRMDYCKGQLASLDGAPAGAGSGGVPGDASKSPVPAAPHPATRAPVVNEDRLADGSAPVQPPHLAPEAAPPAAGDRGQPPDDGAAKDDMAEDGEPAVEPVDPATIAADLKEARTLIEDEQLADATRLLAGVLRADPGNHSARLMIALVRARQGRHDEALVALEDLRGQNEDLPLLLALSAAYCGAGRFFDALLVLDKAIKLAPADPYAYLNLSWLHLAMDEGETGRRDAEAYYRRAVRLGARRDRALEVKLGLE